MARVEGEVLSGSGLCLDWLQIEEGVGIILNISFAHRPQEIDGLTFDSASFWGRKTS